MSLRQATIQRKTNETQIALSITVEGSGQSTLSTQVPFLDHMLDLFTNHGLFDLALDVKGDIEIDDHHSVEDVGICLGQAFAEILKNPKGIVRYASGHYAMDESLVRIAIDICNRPTLSFSPKLTGKVGRFDSELVQEFFQAFVNNARVSLHIDILKGENLHHMIEAVFKGFGVVLDKATQIDPRKKGIPSTKGVL